jgi:hypothetical protein
MQNKFALSDFFFGRFRARKFGDGYCSTHYFLNASTSRRFGHQKPASGALASFLNAASVITTTGDKDAIRRSHC